MESWWKDVSILGMVFTGVGKSALTLLKMWKNCKRKWSCSERYQPDLQMYNNDDLQHENKSRGNGCWSSWEHAGCVPEVWLLSVCQWTQIVFLKSPFTKLFLCKSLTRLSSIKKIIPVLTCCELAGESVTVSALSGIWIGFGCNLSNKGNNNKKLLRFFFFFLAINYRLWFVVSGI